MKSFLSVIVAALFAATSLHVAAQTKDVTTKSGGEVKTKDGASVGRKEVKDKPKGGELPKVEKREPKKKEGGKIVTKDGKEVGTKK